MEIGLNPETGVGAGGIVGAMWAIWASFKSNSFKRLVWERIDANSKNIQEAKEELSDEIATHARYDAENYVKRNELTELRTHIDNKLDAQTQTIFMMLRDGHGKD